tara:strand:- start:115 stop:450 length:336 start_codon:yes stop_codon:yes gene_type:complete
MDKRVTKKKNEIYVFAKFSPRVLHQKRVRFYTSDALTEAQSSFPLLKLLIDDSCSSLTISNYSEPFEGTWKFLVEIAEVDEEMKKLADENFEQQKKRKKINKEESSQKEEE